MVAKITLAPGQALPKVSNPSTHRLFENARGGPYKYGAPLTFNHEVARRITRHEI